MSDTTALELWINRLLLRSALSEDEVESLRTLPFNIENYDANRDFVGLGEMTTHSCIVINGLAGRFDQTRDGTRAITAIHIPGDACDLHSLPVPLSANPLQALARTTIARVSHEALRDVAKQYPAIAQAFFRDCVVDAAILSKWALNAGRTEARQRLAHLFCELALRYALIGQNKCDFPLPITQAHLGDASGLTSIHVNRTIRALSDEGLMRVSQGRVVIEDWDRLVVYADFNPAYLHLADPKPPR